jgi:hypothetical protein
MKISENRLNKENYDYIPFLIYVDHIPVLVIIELFKILMKRVNVKV